MEYLGPDKKAMAVKKFILSYYPEVESVEIDFDKFDAPMIDVYFNQEDTRFANEDTIFRERIRNDVKEYFGFKIFSPYLLPWEKKYSEFQDPDLYFLVHSLNYGK